MNIVFFIREKENLTHIKTYTDLQYNPFNVGDVIRLNAKMWEHISLEDKYDNREIKIVDVQRDLLLNNLVNDLFYTVTHICEFVD